jgi:peroxiredoxin Q/BCP
LGVSFDDQDSHQKFINKYNLNFQLLSDLDKKVAEAYGVYVQKNMYGNISWGIERSTFVINKEGVIAKAFRRVKVEGHTQQVLEVLQGLA